VSEGLFPSGPWTGFYKYTGNAVKHWMELHLTFAHGNLTGEGSDDIGRFVIRGRYDAQEMECHWTKTYLGAHDVYYRGFREGKGIWGTWEIGLWGRGGFHIWPKGAGEAEGESQTAQEPVPAEAKRAVTAAVATAAAGVETNRAQRDPSRHPTIPMAAGLRPWSFPATPAIPHLSPIWSAEALIGANRQRGLRG
jgi:hypothetical protein